MTSTNKVLFNMCPRDRPHGVEDNMPKCDIVELQS